MYLEDYVVRFIPLFIIISCERKDPRTWKFVPELELGSHSFIQENGYNEFCQFSWKSQIFHNHNSDELQLSSANLQLLALNSTNDHAGLVSAWLYIVLSHSPLSSCWTWTPYGFCVISSFQVTQAVLCLKFTSITPVLQGSA